ncbi:hypothetical protein HanXRQr2_Chr15g0717441 [Helianthus annuus]|uniref:Uncharacterized protein n=1 Tax=Helianthus annuus TaxID=4232 RepID=A0A9K3E5Q8_HELAN|nr:hypothetical protein HanXRQr2_Chr15g0717441 [Helianthus annuus]KAJ0833264.1 hypothetical protein HanPSC8_Chr15g0688321 [Helianthus annuus]
MTLARVLAPAFGLLRGHDSCTQAHFCKNFDDLEVKQCHSPDQISVYNMWSSPINLLTCIIT